MKTCHRNHIGVAAMIGVLLCFPSSQLKAQTGVCFSITGENYLDGPTAVHMVTADFNNDGKVDIATGSNNAVHIRLGTGTGNFTNPVGVGFLGSVRYMTVGDFNADGKKDIAFVDMND